MDWDDAYANGPYIAGADAYPDRWASEAQTFRNELRGEGRAELGIAYGSSERQRFDLFTPQGDVTGLCVFVHGGYWLKFHRTFWSHFAQGLLARGWAVAMPSYDLCPEVRIADITGQLANAVAAAAAQLDGPIILAGHSAGGHLVARMGCRAIALTAETRARIARLVPISPVTDLRPLIGTMKNDTLHLDAAEAEAESPLLHAPPDVPVSVWVGSEERPVFLDQAQALARHWGAEHRVDPGRNHFDILDGLVDPESPLINSILG